MEKTPTPHIEPSSLPNPTSSTRPSTRTLVRKVRLEHLAVELLRLGDALRLPVPIDSLWKDPPLGLWVPDPETITVTAMITDEDPYTPRLMTARDIAVRVGKGSWSIKVKLLGSEPFSDEDVTIFARALLIPSQLIFRLSERQKTPENVSIIFQVPRSEAEQRLVELGLMPGG